MQYKKLVFPNFSFFQHSFCSQQAVMIFQISSMEQSKQGGTKGEEFGIATDTCSGWLITFKSILVV